ncbi:MAG: 23S rRNA (pseudouridine(1915)-N(3))-methyltransferase RlmH [Clostridiales Family XIII bacterium]|jgi:23S rRNA (pseudouridine1915-N3)-methyltransferase|nr:23S rRNA (pseudouridine(1915)-N(3))-methyltransferase RlmH [Clostridiales Family XIII bacterium]
MNTIIIICIGNLKEPYLRDACAEYVKRLTPYARVAVTELKEARTSALEGEAILGALDTAAAGAFTVALAIEGKRLSSENFAARIGQLGVDGQSHIAFVIGGSGGLAPAVLKRADLCLSFSDMTFPHQLMRVILLEQIYRAFRILRGEPYHK